MMRRYLSCLPRLLPRRYLNAVPRRNAVLPGLILIGAQKGGTTSLFEYLSKHPEIQPPSTKELNFFNSLGPRQRARKHYSRYFPSRPNLASETAVSIDISPAYMLDAKFVASKIFEFNARMPIAAVLREPVSRAISSWFMYKKYWNESQDWFMGEDWVKYNTNSDIEVVRRSQNFGESMHDDLQEEIDVLDSGRRIECPVIEYGLYRQHLEPFINIFGRDHVLIMESGDLLNHTRSCLDKITDHMGLARYNWNNKDLKQHFVGDNKEPVSREARELLLNYYRPLDAGLSELIGKPLSWM